MLLWSCPVLAYGPKHGQKHGAERKRIPKTEDSLAERDGFEPPEPSEHVKQKYFATEELFLISQLC